MSITVDNAITEAWGKLTATTFTLQARDGGRFALTRLTGWNKPTGAPVICLPGMFTSRHFWASKKGIGLAAHLLQQGFDPWLVERRRIGASPKKSKGRAGMAEHILHDLPLAQAFIHERNTRPAFWLGHSFGGVSAALAASGSLRRESIAGLVLIATQFEVGKKPLARPWNYLTRLAALLLGGLRGRWTGMGPENEPRAAILDACHWVQLAQGKDTRMQRALSGITLPVLAIVGAGDTVDPPTGCRRFIAHMPSDDKTFIEAGTHSGYALGYRHTGIVISKQAQREIWPQVVDWMTQRTSSA